MKRIATIASLILLAVTPAQAVDSPELHDTFDAFFRVEIPQSDQSDMDRYIEKLFDLWMVSHDEFKALAKKLPRLSPESRTRYVASLAKKDPLNLLHLGDAELKILSPDEATGKDTIYLLLQPGKKSERVATFVFKDAIRSDLKVQKYSELVEKFIAEMPK